MNLQLSQYKVGSFPGQRQTGTKKSLRTLSYSTRSAREPQLMHLPTPDFSTCRTCCSNPPMKKKNIASLLLVPSRFFRYYVMLFSSSHCSDITVLRFMLSSVFTVSGAFVRFLILWAFVYGPLPLYHFGLVRFILHV